ncbi:starch synthase [Rhizobiales bacterium GAS188]|nr:starch synthase [Rhizobiales bacterium GAS188]
MPETDAHSELPARLWGFHPIGDAMHDSATVTDPLAVIRKPRPEPARRVLFVTPEIADFVKVGGLGEVSAALPRSLLANCDVRVLVPGYRSVLRRRDEIELLGTLPALAGIPQCGLGRIVMSDGLVTYVVLCDELYDRDGTPYNDRHGGDFPDNDIRFARLSLAAADIAGGLGDPDWTPDLIHANDWPAALAPAYALWRGVGKSSLLTVHNLAYQGVFDAHRRGLLGIPDHAFSIHGAEFYGKLSFLKAGIYYASHVTTVSSTYAHEITKQEFGCGLHGLLADRARQGRLSGILNGIDESWDPRGSTAAPRHRFDAVAWKGRNADHVRGAFSLALSRGPLFAIVSRLVHQKGLDLAIDAAESIVDGGGQLVATGQGEPRFEEAMRDLARRHPGTVGVRIGFDDQEARRMFAASDFLLMPSRFEPCGLSQMYAQKFGSLPIAYKTGGLADTIEDGVTGFLFNKFSHDGLASAIRRAFETHASQMDLRRMRRVAMSRKFDWKRSAAHYLSLYRRMTAVA